MVGIYLLLLYFCWPLAAKARSCSMFAFIFVSLLFVRLLVAKCYCCIFVDLWQPNCTSGAEGKSFAKMSFFQTVPVVIDLEIILQVNKWRKPHKCGLRITCLFTPRQPKTTPRRFRDFPKKYRKLQSLGVNIFAHWQHLRLVFWKTHNPKISYASLWFGKFPRHLLFTPFS